MLHSARFSQQRRLEENVKNITAAIHTSKESQKKGLMAAGMNRRIGAAQAEAGDPFAPGLRNVKNDDEMLNVNSVDGTARPRHKFTALGEVSKS